MSSEHVSILEKLIVPDDIKRFFKNRDKYVIPNSRAELLDLAFGGDDKTFFEIAYDIPELGRIAEARVVRCKNGASVNFTSEYMRRRDPNCMFIADKGETDKPKYKDVFGNDFKQLRDETFDWLEDQNLIIMPFMAGGEKLGYPALLVAPKNAGFFAGGLADLQGFIPKDKIPKDFKPRAIIYLAPPFRHTHFSGKQAVVHNRLENMHEVFAYNLYPGPSAKKGIYSVLLNIGEQEGWITVHGSVAKVITPYDNEIVIMHEGASGSGKSEMIEYMHKDAWGKALLGENVVTNEKLYLKLLENCELKPVTDDMALCHPSLQKPGGRLSVIDAESGWFLRINHITEYGTDPHYEKLCLHPKEPLIFLNMEGMAGSTCLIWEHTMDTPEKRCPNPRIVMPRNFVPDIVDEPVEIDIRSFGIRTPPCTKEDPSYGIIGCFHILPPSLAWLWRLVAPRGYANPSITDSGGMSSEGVGSYWPFATGKKVTQANLLLEQIKETVNTKFLLIPNQHIGAYKVGFMGQWIAREYLARRGIARFKPDQLVESKCPILGYGLQSLKVDGTFLPKGFLQVEKQPEVGDKGFQAGAKMLTDFFKEELKQFLTPELDHLGRKIIECCLNDGTLEEYDDLIPVTQ